MGAQRTSFDKLQRDRAKKAKQAAKREQRLNKGNPEEGAEELEPLEAIPPGEELSAADLMGRVEELHARLEAGTITFDDFEEAKADLLGRVRID